VGVAEWLDTTELRDPQALVLIARARAGAGQFDAARDTLRRVDKLVPDSVEAAVARGHLEHRAGKRDAAIAAFRVATQRDATHLRARIELAALLITRGSVLEAETVLLEACAIAPKDKQPVLVLAALRREEGKAQEAIDLLVAFLKSEPYAVDVLAALGEALYSVCRYDDAHFAFRRVLRFDAVNIAALYYDGVLLARADRPIEALDRWTQVIELDPASMFARRARRDALTVEASQAGRSSPSEGA
jgi:tetratricopeptide (TPR) repeat protein